MAAIHVAPAAAPAAAALPYPDQAAFLHALDNGPVQAVVDALKLLAPQQRAEQLRLVGSKHVSTLIDMASAAQWLAVLDGLSDDERRPLLTYDATLNAKAAQGYATQQRRQVYSGLSLRARTCIDNVRMHPAGTTGQPTLELLDAVIKADLPFFAAVPTGTKVLPSYAPHVFERVVHRDYVTYNANLVRPTGGVNKLNAKRAEDTGRALKPKTAEELAHVVETWVVVEPPARRAGVNLASCLSREKNYKTKPLSQITLYACF
jgi:hypothetical protein